MFFCIRIFLYHFLVFIGESGLGSDCSGLSSNFLALKMCGIPVEGVFISEIDSSKLAMSKAMHARFGCSPKVTGNIETRDPEMTPQVDLYVTGPPCPPFSSAGKKKALRDDRGAVLIHSLKYTVMRRPRVLVLENVKGLTHSKNRHILDKIVKILRNCNYSCKAEIVNTSQHGLPHHRERLYLVAVQKQDGMKLKPFSFPRPVDMPKLERFMVHSCQQSEKLSERELTLMKGLKKKFQLGKPEELTDEVVMDVGATLAFATCMSGKSPCLTKTPL